MGIFGKLFGGSTRTGKNKPSASQIDPAQWRSLSDAFHEAAKHGDIGTLQTMLKNAPNLALSRITFFGESPMHAAARQGHKDVVALLLQHGADVNTRDQNRQTPLNDAATHGHADVVSLLLAKGADINATMHHDLTPLHNAAVRGHMNIVKLLLTRGAEVNAKDGDGRTPLNYAESKGHADVVQLLMQKGGRAKPKSAMIVKRPAGPLKFATHEEIVAALKAGKVAADDPVWVDGVALMAVKHVVDIVEMRGRKDPTAKR